MSMPPDLLFWLALVLKMVVTAGLVIGAAIVAERAGTAIGALVATLPIAAGPAYFFVALDHDAAFISQSAIGSIAAHAATAAFSLVYIVLAQRFGIAVSVTGAVAVWFILAFLLRSVQWTFLSVAAVNLAMFAVCIVLTAPYRHVPMPRIVSRWYDVPVRALMVSCLVAAVVGLSNRVGPIVTGLLAVYPIVMTSLMLIFQSRVGGPATAALIANTMWGLIGFSTALFTVHLATVPLGAPAGLALALAVSVAWNLTLWGLHRRVRVQPYRR
jgi:uncharacterized membrane protein (GlpM family)